MEEVSKQYNNFSKSYSDNLEVQDEVGNRRFYEVLSTVELNGRKLLDIGCGDGTDLINFQNKGAVVSGIDPSEAFIQLAKAKDSKLEVILGRGEELPFADQTFDVVVSKYALQTSPAVPKIIEEAARVLKPGGYFIYLSKHPLRQFLEKIETLKTTGKVNYYEQEVVDSYIYERTIHLREPSHTITEYFSTDVLKKFDLLDYLEDSDFPASEQLHGYTYPTFFIAKLKRRNSAE